MRTRTRQAAFGLAPLLLAITLLASAAGASWAAASRDSSQVESAPAPLIKAPRNAAPAESAEEDTAVVAARKRAREDFGRGLMLEEDKAYSAAIISYTNAARRDPTLKGPSYRIGLLFMSRQQYEPAARAFREEYRRDPGNNANTMEYALALCELGDSTRSLRMLGDLSRRAPTDADIWRSLEFVHGRLGHYEQAEKALRGAVALKPGFSKAWRDLGVVLAARNRPREAREAYRRSLEIDPKDESALINLANLDSREGAHEQALELYRRAERVDSTQALAYRGQLRELIALGRESEGGDVWRRWLAASGGDGVIREGAARHFVRQERTDIALELARDGIRANPRAGESWWLLAEMQTAAGETRAALESYRRAWHGYVRPADKQRAEDSIRALRAAAPDSLRQLFEADSLAAHPDTTAGKRK